MAEEHPCKGCRYWADGCSIDPRAMKSCPGYLGILKYRQNELHRLLEKAEHRCTVAAKRNAGLETAAREVRDELRQADAFGRTAMFSITVATTCSRLAAKLDVALAAGEEE